LAVDGHAGWAAVGAQKWRLAEQGRQTCILVEARPQNQRALSLLPNPKGLIQRHSHDAVAAANLLAAHNFSADAQEAYQLKQK
jgi:hypothetical protein